MTNPLVLLAIFSIVLLIQNSLAKSVSDHPQSAVKQLTSDYSYPTPEEGTGKRAMRNALLRSGRSSQCRRLTRSLRSSAAMRNALVRFGKRSAFPFPPVQPQPFDGQQEGMANNAKRNSAPEPFGANKIGRIVEFAFFSSFRPITAIC